VWFRKPKPDPADVIRGLREQAFTVPASDVNVVPSTGHSRVWTVLMETGHPQAVASLVAVADGTTSMYFSNGGGILGAGQQATVRQASERFIALVDLHVDSLAVAEAHPLPAVGRVRFYARTFDGLRTAEAGEQELGEHRHPLSHLFHAGHAVITAVREASPPV
jgi:hypothetical protein